MILYAYYGLIRFFLILSVRTFYPTINLLGALLDSIESTSSMINLLWLSSQNSVMKLAKAGNLTEMPKYLGTTWNNKYPG